MFDEKNHSESVKSVLEWAKKIETQDIHEKYRALRSELYEKALQMNDSEGENGKITLSNCLAALRQLLPVDVAVTMRVFKPIDGDFGEISGKECPDIASFVEFLYDGVIASYLKHSKQILPSVLLHCRNENESDHDQNDAMTEELVQFTEGINFIVDLIDESVSEMIENKIACVLDEVFSPHETAMVRSFQSAIVLAGKSSLLRESEWYNAHNEYLCCSVSFDSFPHENLPGKVAQSCVGFADVVDRYLRIAGVLRLPSLCNALAQTLSIVLERIISRLELAAADVPLYNSIDFLYISLNSIVFLERYVQQWAAIITEGESTPLDSTISQITVLMERLFENVVSIHVHRLRFYILSDIEENEWRSTRPYRGHCCVTRGLLSWATCITVLPEKLAIQGLSSELSAKITRRVITLICLSITQRYSAIKPQICRLDQYSTDICFLLCCFSSFLNVYSDLGCLREYIVRLLSHACVLLVPLSDLISLIEGKSIDSDTVHDPPSDPIFATLNEVYPSAITFTSGIQPMSAIDGLKCCAIYKDFTGKALKWKNELNVNWEVIMSQILFQINEKGEKGAEMIVSLQRRAELQSDVYPRLDATETRLVAKLEEFVSKFSVNYGT